MNDLLRTLPESIAAMIGPQRISDVPVHNEEYDFDGLASFVINTIFEKNREIHK